jgi:drug/metabolite transporter (DMT)-like permease
VVVPILQAAPLLVVGLSVAFLPRRLERVTPRLVAAAAAVVVGTVVVSLSG